MPLHRRRARLRDTQEAEVNSMSQTEILTAALEAEVIAAVRSAGALLTARGAVHDIRAKSRTDFVTDVDMRVQAMLRSRLGELAPGVQFMGEEQDNAAIDPSRPCWILDPVDGRPARIRRRLQPLRRRALHRALRRRRLPERAADTRHRHRLAEFGPGQRGHLARPTGMGRHGLFRDARAL